jgi:membrane dipeptidase
MKFLFTFLFFLSFNSFVFSQDYKKLHKKSIVVDTHNDLLSASVMKGLRIEDDLRGKAHSDFKRFKEGGVDVQVFSVFCDSSYGEGTAFRFANAEIDSLLSIIRRNPQTVSLVTSSSELKKAVKNKKMAAMIGIEGGHMIENKLSYLDSLYRRGAIYMTLTWYNSNPWASSSSDEFTNDLRYGYRGLNEWGINLVKHMNEIGMIIDISHVGVQTFRDVIANTNKPVIASHSDVYSLVPDDRNLTDEQIKLIAQNGGVIQLNFCSPFLDSTYITRRNQFEAQHAFEIDSMLKADHNWAYIMRQYPAEAEALRPPLSVLFNHLDYIVKLAGVDYVGLGSDFDGVSSTPKDLEDVSKYPNITKGLLERGYSRRDIKKMLGGNFIRVLKANEVTTKSK